MILLPVVADAQVWGWHVLFHVVACCLQKHVRSEQLHIVGACYARCRRLTLNATTSKLLSGK